MKAPAMNRRGFGATVAASVATGAALTAIGSDAKAKPATTKTAAIPAATNGRFLTAVKWGMIESDGSPVERFRLCQELGYDGMELISPNNPPVETLRSASLETGMPIHGVVDDKHWEVRLSSPDQSTRDAGRAFLEQAIRDSAGMGGHTVLLVPGVVDENATHDQVWSRSIAEIRKTLPLAASLGVRVLIENVWNGFCETPELLRDYLDEIDSPWVGSYYDIGNAQKFSPTEHWIRTLGSHIVKLDVKDWGVTAGFCKIGDGDVNWSAVRDALDAINYSGWCTAEVAGGGRERLADIAQRMTTALNG